MITSGSMAWARAGGSSSGRVRYCPLHGVAAAGDGFAGVIRATRQDHDQRQGCAMPAGSRQPPVQGAKGETSFGSPTSPMSRPGPDSSTSLVIDAYARRIMGWRASRTAHAAFVLDALEQHCMIHCRSIVAGSVGHSYDDALAEAIDRFYKAVVIHRCGPWRRFEPSSLRHWNGSTGSRP